MGGGGGGFLFGLRAYERNDGGINLDSMKAFNSFILGAMMIDIPLSGLSFTWSNNREHAAWACLYRFLISLWILSWFSKLSQSGLSRTVSDHSVILLGELRDGWGPSPFHFYNAWMKDDDLMNSAKVGWLSCQSNRPTGFALFDKIKSTKKFIQAYLLSKKKRGYSLKDCELRLENVENRAVLEGWSMDLRKKKNRHSLGFMEKYSKG
ncbi:hypothetical protein Ddye_013991 [Dipteronia dyeriana]|uniref:Uncharacterized protein n=1 Tax=Dipteronia dyeriana TaxID=168575 RepID=A0AAD9X788_9ROSI|nr:hypothetical protein Ddye_013991 [Dipteronia dyeriana]